MAYINGQKILFSPRIQITGNGTGGDAILAVSSLPKVNISSAHFYYTPDNKVYWYDGANWHEVAENADLISLQETLDTLQNEVSGISFNTLPDRPFYDDGSTVYTQSEQWYDSTSIQARAYLATTEVLTEQELRNFSVKSIYTDKSSGVEVVTEGSYPLSDARVTNYTGGYILNANAGQAPDPRILVVTDCVAFSNDVGDISLHLNGIYLLDSYSDNMDADFNMYTNTNNVFRLYYSDFKYLDNKFLNLPENEDLKKALKSIKYDDLLDRPFGDDVGEPIHVTITADSLEGGHRVSFNGGFGNWEAVQVSEVAYTKEQLLGGEAHGSSDTFFIDESHIVEDTDDGLKLQFGEGIYDYIWVAHTTNYQPEGFDAPLPAVGVYFSYYYDGPETRGTQQLEFSHRRKMLDNKFLDLPKNEDFKALKKKVEEGGSGGTNNIVVPAKNSRGNADFVESIPGLVKLYNQSAGLDIDEYGQLGIVAATNDEIAKKESRRKPIVPATMKYAMQENSFTGNLADILSTSNEANTPVGAFAAKDFVLNNILNFKLYKIPRGGMFEVKPGMIALVLPYGDYTLSVHESKTAAAKISKMGATIVMATDWGSDSEDPNCYWTAFMYVKTATIMPTMGSNHTKYTQNCYIKNNDTGTSGTGYAYVYYLSRGDD